MMYQFMAPEVTALTIGGVPYRRADVNCTEGFVAWEPDLSVLVLHPDSPLGRAWRDG